jgi:hypothetical protein
MACTQTRAPFRSRRGCCLFNRRLARNDQTENRALAEYAVDLQLQPEHCLLSEGGYIGSCYCKVVAPGWWISDSTSLQLQRILDLFVNGSVIGLHRNGDEITIRSRYGRRRREGIMVRRRTCVTKGNDWHRTSILGFCRLKEYVDTGASRVLPSAALENWDWQSASMIAAKRIGAGGLRNYRRRAIHNRRPYSARFKAQMSKPPTVRTVTEMSG